MEKLDEFKAEVAALAPESEQKFILEAMPESQWLTCKKIKEKEVETTKYFACKNTYERRIIHVIAESMKLFHGRWGGMRDFPKHGEIIRTWVPREGWYDHYYDAEDGMRCEYCRNAALQKYYRILGVWVSNRPQPQTQKDRRHRKHYLNQFRNIPVIKNISRT